MLSTIPSPHRRRGRPGAPRPGFTLLETAMALVIIGVGVLAFIDAQSAFTRNNAWSSQAATATLLANEIREMTRRLPRHDPVTGLSMQGTGAGATLSGWGREAGETTAQDIDDVDDLDGMKFGDGGDLPGPINSLGEVVQATDKSGNPLTDADGVPVPIQGWSQTVFVDKVDPFNYTTVRADDYSEAASGSFPGRSVDQYPLRVTVVVEYQGPNDSAPREMTRMVWVVP